jgi:hypothetical protein
MFGRCTVLRDDWWPVMVKSFCANNFLEVELMIPVHKIICSYDYVHFSYLNLQVFNIAAVCARGGGAIFTAANTLVYPWLALVEAVFGHSGYHMLSCSGPRLIVRSNACSIVLPDGSGPNISIWDTLTSVRAGFWNLVVFSYLATRYILHWKREKWWIQYC